MNIMHGCPSFVSSLAVLKSLDTFFSASPSHLLMMLAASTVIKYPSISAAVAAASIVLPHPGGPYSNIPLGQPRGNRSGLLEGKMIASLRALFESSRPTTSSILTSGFSFTTRSSKDAFRVSTIAPLDEELTFGENSSLGLSGGSIPLAD